MARQTVYKLNRLIIIQHNANADSDSTDPTPNWQMLCTAYASKKPLTGQLLFTAATANMQDDVLFTIHYRDPDTLKGAQQIVDGTRIYTITIPPTDPYGDRAWLQIHAKEVLQNGG